MCIEYIQCKYRKFCLFCSRCWNGFCNFMSHLWLFGALFKAKRKDYASALYEFLYLVLWSFLPFALGALTLYVTSDFDNKKFIELGLSTFRNGELLVFTISMMAPILFMTLHDPENLSGAPFPHKLPISTTVALIAVTCAALFALLKASAVKDLDFVFRLSVILTCVALLFRYLAIVYGKVRANNAPNEMELRQDQNDFVGRFEEHIKDNKFVNGAQDFASQYKARVEGQ